jgi:hypothetical protein
MSLNVVDALCISLPVFARLASLYATMTFWIRNISSNPLGLGLGPSESVHMSHDLRKARESGRGPTKARRYSYNAYRDAPYRTSDPSRHFRVGSKYPVAATEN